jgi:hypothetical protein
VDPQTTQVDDLRLVALPTAMNCADMFVRFALREWHLVALQDEASHVASELVANVVERNTESVPGFLTLRLRLHGDCLVIEVEDTEVLPPFVPKSLEGRKGGAMANPAGGNFLWCEVALPSGVKASAVPLPRRERRKPPNSVPASAYEESPEVDDEFFERLLSKLHRSPEEPPPGGLM